MCVVFVCVHNMVYLEARGQLLGVSFFFSFHHLGPEALTQVSHQAWQQAPVPTGPSRPHTLVQSVFYFLGLEKLLSC